MEGLKAGDGSEELMKIGEFAKFCGTTVDTLLHYDKTGLLKPASVRDNGYRYYVPNQFNRFVSVNMMVRAHVPLARIKEILHERSFEGLIGATSAEREAVNEEIRRLEESRRWLGALEERARWAEELVVGEPRVVEMPEQYCVVIGAMKATTVAYSEDPTILQAMRRITRELLDISPVAGLSPYGHCAQGPLSEGPVLYDNMFYLVTKEVARHFRDVLVIPAGVYVQLGFLSSWDNIAPVHRRLMECVEAQGGDPAAPRYEYAAFQLFDAHATAGYDDYRGVLMMPLKTS